jgi:hypothetical protein
MLIYARKIVLVIAAKYYSQHFLLHSEAAEARASL